MATGWLGGHVAEVPPNVPTRKLCLRRIVDEGEWHERDSFVIPADVDAVSVSSHAHYLAKETKLTATLPTGEVRILLWIRSWDFNWQDTYLFQDLVRLPKGTRLDGERTCAPEVEDWVAGDHVADRASPGRVPAPALLIASGDVSRSACRARAKGGAYARVSGQLCADQLNISWVNDWCYYHSGHRRRCRIYHPRGSEIATRRTQPSAGCRSSARYSIAADNIAAIELMPGDMDSVAAGNYFLACFSAFFFCFSLVDSFVLLLLFCLTWPFATGSPEVNVRFLELCPRIARDASSTS